MKNSPKFKLTEVIIITVISSLLMSFTIGFAVYSNYKRNNIDLDDKYLKTFISTYNDITSKFYDEVDKEVLIENAINGMVESLDDPYTTFMDENNKNLLFESIKGKYEGIGVEITTKDEKVVIMNIFDDSPASKAGLKVKDVIHSINGKVVKSSEEASLLIRHSNEKNFKIEILRNNKKQMFNIKRKSLDIPVVHSEVLNENIGYIGLTSFSEDADKQFANHLSKLKNENIKSLIIDLRSNSGGVLKSASNIGELFIENNKPIYKMKTKLRTTTKKSKNKEPESIKTIILIDERSASASEVLTLSLTENNNNAKTVGVTSYGKGKVQQTSELKDGSLIKYTTAYWLSPKGNNIDGKGIKPDYEVKLNEIFYEEPKIENDNQLQKALELLK